MKQEIAISRGMILIPSVKTNQNPNVLLAASVAAELTRLGFMIDGQAINALAELSLNQMWTWRKEVIEILKKKIGSNGATPLWTNFPHDVLSASQSELYLVALFHYWSNGHWTPPQELVKKGVFKESAVELKKLEVASDEEFDKIFTRLVGSNQSLSEQDKKAMRWFVTTYSQEKLAAILPKAIPFKETLCELAAMGVDVPVRNETDVLRIALAMSGVDTALLPISTKAEDKGKQHFKKFDRFDRRFILNLLEKTDPVAEEMQTHVGRWLRLGEILHVGEYQRKFPKSYAAFHRLRNQQKVKIRNFASSLEWAQKTGNAAEAVRLLKLRPGEFARRFDSLLRNATLDNQQLMVNAFGEVASRVSSKVLCELYEHVQNRSKPTQRAIMAKGSRGVTTLETLPALHPSIVKNSARVIEDAMLVGLSKLPTLSSVYIDEQLKGLPLLKGARTMSEGASLPRGARVGLGEKAEYIRMFLHWYDERGRIDLDLSSRFLDENARTIGHISFTNLRSMGCYHSGDIRHRVGRNAEFIDLSITDLIKQRVRYATLEVYNFNGGSLKDVPECKVGFMLRSGITTGEPFEPKAVKTAYTPASPVPASCSCVFDLVERKMVWIDVDLGSDRMIEQSQVDNSIAPFIKKPNFSVYDLIKLHATARGAMVVNTRNKAHAVFDYNEIASDMSKQLDLTTW